MLLPFTAWQPFTPAAMTARTRSGVALNFREYSPGEMLAKRASPAQDPLHLPPVTFSSLKAWFHFERVEP